MKLNKFAELCIHTRCKAFVNRDGEIPAEDWIEELSTCTLPIPEANPPQVSLIKIITINGVQK